MQKIEKIFKGELKKLECYADSDPRKRSYIKEIIEQYNSILNNENEPWDFSSIAGLYIIDIDNDMKEKCRSFIIILNEEYERINKIINRGV